MLKNLKILPAFKTTKVNLENLNSKPHMKCRGFQGLLPYDDNSNVTKVGNMD
jgi:hypothetical protein